MDKTRIVESLKDVDYSDMTLPMVTIYAKPADYPNHYVARVWEAKGSQPTNIIIKRKTLQEVKEDVKTAGFNVRLLRNRKDDPCIVETWL